MAWKPAILHSSPSFSIATTSQRKAKYEERNENSNRTNDETERLRWYSRRWSTAVEGRWGHCKEEWIHSMVPKNQEGPKFQGQNENHNCTVYDLPVPATPDSVGKQYQVEHTCLYQIMSFCGQNPGRYTWRSRHWATFCSRASSDVVRSWCWNSADILIDLRSTKWSWASKSGGRLLAPHSLEHYHIPPTARTTLNQKKSLVLGSNIWYPWRKVNLKIIYPFVAGCYCLLKHQVWYLSTSLQLFSLLYNLMIEEYLKRRQKSSDMDITCVLRTTAVDINNWTVENLQRPVRKEQVQFGASPKSPQSPYTFATSPGTMTDQIPWQMW